MPVAAGLVSGLRVLSAREPRRVGVVPRAGGPAGRSVMADTRRWGGEGPAGSVFVKGEHCHPVDSPRPVLAQPRAGSALEPFTGATSPRVTCGGGEQHRCVLLQFWSSESKASKCHWAK